MAKEKRGRAATNAGEERKPAGVFASSRTKKKGAAFCRTTYFFGQPIATKWRTPHAQFSNRKKDERDDADFLYDLLVSEGLANECSF